MTAALIWASALVASVALLCITALSAWRGWLDLRRGEIAAGRGPAEPAAPDAEARIEMAAVKDRLRKLEAIARGVDL